MASENQLTFVRFFVMIWIKDHLDQGSWKEPINPLWAKIHQFLWWTMIRVLVIITDLDPGYPEGIHPESVNGASILKIITQN